MKMKNIPYKWWPLDMILTARLIDIGDLKVIIRPISGHFFLWINNVYLGRTWSLNQIGDDYCLQYDDSKLDLKCKWIPVWKIEIFKDDISHGEYKFLFQTILFYLFQILFLVFAVILINIIYLN